MKSKLGTKLTTLNTFKAEVDSSMAKNVYSSETYGNRTSSTNPDEIFRKGSTTYYYSTKLFPAKIRREVTQQYNFVRVADDYVDSVPQDTEGFMDFKKEYYRVLSGKTSDNKVITDFVELSQKRKFLCELLTKNLIFLTSEFKINVDKKILTDIELDDESLANFKENKDIGFEGSFLTNFILPDFIGLGNGITRGCGSIKHDQKIKDSEIDISKFYTFDKKNINSKSNNKNSPIKKRKKFLPKKTVNNEENEINYNTLKNNISNSVTKRKKNNSKKIKKKKVSERSFENKNFNSEEYHKKQHSI